MTPSEVEGPQEYKSYFEDFAPKPDKEFGRKPKFCLGPILQIRTRTTGKT
jgi:hypothetical protein